MKTKTTCYIVMFDRYLNRHTVYKEMESRKVAKEVVLYLNVVENCHNRYKYTVESNDNMCD